MSADRTSGLLLRLYPPGWRARYGEELAALIVEANGGRVPWGVRIDVVSAAVTERLRATGLAGDRPPAERIRGGALAVLGGWAAFVVAGMLVQKFSEHWQAAMPAGRRTTPQIAFDALLVSAWVGSALVVVGVAAVAPELVRFVRSGGLGLVRRPLISAVALTVAAVPASVGVVVWAGNLTAAQRDGRDGAYALIVGIWVLLLVGCLVAWTVVGFALAWRLELSFRVLRLEALLAAGVAAAMVSMTAATTLWWASVARSAPWFLAGAPQGSNASPLAPQLLTATILMVIATGLAVIGATRAVHPGRRDLGSVR